MSREGVLKEVSTERDYQDTQWGRGLDDRWVEKDWQDFIDNYSKALGRAEKYKDDFRTRMVKVAAIAVAAVEAMDRKAKA
jgi:hypothetical protein